jgi:hypothetical protein
MPANGRWDLIRRLKVKNQPSKQVHDSAGGLEHRFTYDIKNEDFFFD